MEINDKGMMFGQYMAKQKQGFIYQLREKIGKQDKKQKTVYSDILLEKNTLPSRVYSERKVQHRSLASLIFLRKITDLGYPITRQAKILSHQLQHLQQNSYHQIIPKVQQCVSLFIQKQIFPQTQIITQIQYGKRQILEFGVQCIICLEKYSEEDIISPLQCEHRLCVYCLKQYLNCNYESPVKITNGIVLTIPCVIDGCKQEFKQKEIEERVTYQQFLKYKKFKKNIQISKNPNIRWCTTPQCQTYIQGKPGVQKLICPICSAQICFKCGYDYHQGIPCQQAHQQGYKELARNINIKHCPSCRSICYKQYGCNHMTCSRCFYEFCWICLGKYSDYHYQWFNICGCPGGQDGQRQNWRLYRCLGVVCFIPIVLLILGLGMLITGLILVIGPLLVPSLFTQFCDIEVCQGRYKYLKIILVIILSILLYPISFIFWLFGGSCYSIPFLILIDSQ